MPDYYFFFEQEWCHYWLMASALCFFVVVGLVKPSLKDVKQNDLKKKKKKKKGEERSWTFRRGNIMVCEGILFQILRDIHGHSVFCCCFFFLVVGWRSCDGTYSCNLNAFSYFTFHLHSLYKTVSLFFFLGGGVHHCEKSKWFQNSTHLLFWTYMYFCNVLKNQYKKANTSINVAIALWLNIFFTLIISSAHHTDNNKTHVAAADGTTSAVLM